MANASDLTVVNGDGRGHKPWRRRTLDESEQVVCPHCNGSVTMHVTLGPRRAPGGKMIAGTKIIACAICFSQGELIELGRQ